MTSSMIITLQSGEQKEVPTCQLEISQLQQIVAIGIDFDKHPTVAAESVPGVKIENIGKLSSWTGLFGIRIENSLKNFNWDFQQFPDPELILLTDER